MNQRMELAYPLELFRQNFDRHVAFLKECSADQVPLYYTCSSGERERHFKPAITLDQAAELLRGQVRTIRDSGLRIDVIYAGGGIGATILDRPEQQEEYRHICRVASEQQIKIIGLGLPNPPRANTDATWFDTLVRNYRWMSDVAASSGLKLASHCGTDCGRRFCTIADLEEWLMRVDRDNNGLTFCFGNIALAGEDVPAAIRRLARWIFSVHVRQTAGTFGKTGQERPLHSGEIDLRYCLKVLSEIGYTGILHPEHFPRFATALAPERRDLWYLAGEPDGPTLAWTLGYLRGLINAVG